MSQYTPLAALAAVLIIMWFISHGGSTTTTPSGGVGPASQHGGAVAPPPPPPPTEGPPTMRFKRYESSTFERHFPSWHDNRPCDALARNAILNSWNEQYIALLPRCCVPHNPPPRQCPTDGSAPPSHESPITGLPQDVFSSMVYTIDDGRGGGGKEVRIPIEPIAGVLRHPALCNRIAAARPRGVDFGAVIDKGYFIIDPLAVRQARGRRIYFDVGGSTWNEGPGGASQQFFHDLFNSMCLPIDEYYVWEATPLPANVVERVPPNVRPHYHWYNMPASPDAVDAMNPLNKLREVATPSDYVVFKLDIDHGPTEIRLVDQLLADERLWHLVDEFLFEHHVDFAPMNTYWAGTMQGRMNDSLRIFRSLRQRGIRAHSWV